MADYSQMSRSVCVPAGRRRVPAHGRNAVLPRSIRSHTVGRRRRAKRPDQRPWGI